MLFVNLQIYNFSTYSFAFSTDYPMITLASFFALDNQWKKQLYRWKNWVLVKLALENSPKCLKLENGKSWANFAFSLTNLGLNQTREHFRHMKFYMFWDFIHRILCNNPMSNFLSDIWNIYLHIHLFFVA